jgi:hypothetical protein
MSRLVVSEFVTLDRVMEDPGGSEKSKYAAWTCFNEEFARVVQLTDRERSCI